MKFPSPYNFVFLGVNNCLIFFTCQVFFIPATSSSSYSQNSVKLLSLQTNTSGIFFFLVFWADNLHGALCPPFLFGLVVLQAYCTTVLKLLFIIILRNFLPFSSASFLFSGSFIFPFHGYTLISMKFIFLTQIVWEVNFLRPCTSENSTLALIDSLDQISNSRLVVIFPQNF